MMKIDVLSLFPEMFEGVLHSSIMKKAQDNGAVSFDVTDFRDHSADKHRKVDDYPYGGGAGMVLKPEPLFAAVEALSEGLEKPPRVVLMCPQGERFTQKKAEELPGKNILSSSAAIMKAMMSGFVSILSRMNYPSVISY